MSTFSQACERQLVDSEAVTVAVVQDAYELCEKFKLNKKAHGDKLSRELFKLLHRYKPIIDTIAYDWQTPSGLVRS